MLQVNNISFSYSEEKKTLQNISFSLNKGEHLCIMGESGCGKSTLLKLIYGLLDTHKGSLFWDNNEILGPGTHLIPGMDFFKYVPQDFELMPFTSVTENISKFLSRFHPEEAKLRTQELLEVIEMESYADTKVKNLSGGQQQRVAIARALAKEPELLLLDEPFSQIDNFKKSTLRRNLFSYLKQQKISCIVATHDGNDALSFADQLIVIKDHTILTSGNPKELYENPKSTYIASLFDDVNEITLYGKHFILYPHQIHIVKNSELKAIIKNNYFRGSYWLIEIELNDTRLFLTHKTNITVDTSICVRFKLPL